MVEEIRVVMIGKTGVGKSALGNSILGENVFRSTAAAKSISKESMRGIRMFGEYCKVVLVDTPGLFNTDTKDIMETAKILTTQQTPAPHVFMFVLSIQSRFTVEEKAGIEFLKDLLGSHVTDYMITVFTGKDCLTYDDIDLETYIDEADDDLKNVVSQCRGRVAINNRASLEEVTRSVDEILQLIKRVYLQNEKKCYTDEMLAEAQKKFEEKLRLLKHDACKRERELEGENEKLEQEREDDKKNYEYALNINREPEKEVKKLEEKMDYKVKKNEALRKIKEQVEIKDDLGDANARKIRFFGRKQIGKLTNVDKF